MTIQRCCSCTSDRNVYRELWTYVKVARPIERWHVPFNASIEHTVRDVSFLRLLRSLTKNVVITIQPSILKAPSFDCHRATLIFTLRSLPLQRLCSIHPSVQADRLNRSSPTDIDENERTWPVPSKLVTRELELPVRESATTQVQRTHAKAIAQVALNDAGCLDATRYDATRRDAMQRD